MVLMHAACAHAMSATGASRLGAGLAALFATVGVLLSMAGAATLLGQPAALGPLNDSAGRCQRIYRHRFATALRWRARSGGAVDAGCIAPAT